MFDHFVENLDRLWHARLINCAPTGEILSPATLPMDIYPYN